jgi:CHAT domain-containing protein/Tfp pilus assembly protein PilF
MQPAAAYEQLQALIRLGNLPAARSKAHEISVNLEIQNPYWSWKFRLVEAQVLSWQGHYTEALDLTASTIPDTIASRGDLVLRRLLIRAGAHLATGDRDLVGQEMEDVSARCHDNSCASWDDVLLVRGVIHIHDGNAAEAGKMFRKSLEIARQRNDTYKQASILLNLGVLALHQEYFDEALTLLNASSDLAKPIHARLLLEKNTGNMGWAYHLMGNYEQALENFRQATEEATQLGVVADQAKWQTNAAQDTWLTGDLEGAVKLNEEVLPLAEKIEDTQDQDAIRVNLAYLYFLLNQPEKSEKYIDEGLAIARRIGDKRAELDIESLQGTLADKSGDYQTSKKALRAVYEQSKGYPDLQWDIENRIANLYAKTNQNPLATQWYNKSLCTFETQRATGNADTSRLPFFANGDKIYSDYSTWLVEHGKTDAALQLLDTSRARTLEEGLDLRSKKPCALTSGAVNPAALARKLHGAILFYWLDEKTSYLWATSASGTRLFHLPPAAEITARVQSYHKAILNSSDAIATQNEAGRDLYDTLIAPAQAMIPKGSKVYIIADGSLNELNFETLLAPKPSLHYWIEDVTVTNIDSLRMLNAFASHPVAKGPGNLLLIGNPSSPGKPYEDLPNAPKEIQHVEEHFPSARRLVLTGQQAVPAAYDASHPEKFSYIHFVAHGMASRLSPLDSAVVLSPTPGDPDSFKLYARDIIRRRLHAELVTISACYGSGSREYAGEGLIGLSWAFLRAGSHYVIGALWEVNDSAAPEFIDHLYDELARGHSPDTALRDAKLSLIHSQNIHRKPYYWATFQLYGGV